MSKEEHDEELRQKKGDEAKLQMALDESRRQSVAAAPVSPLHGSQVIVVLHLLHLFTTRVELYS